MRYLFIFICLVLIILPMTIEAQVFDCTQEYSKRSKEYAQCYHFRWADECFDEVDRLWGPYSPEGHRQIKEKYELTVKRHGWGTNWFYRVGNSIRGEDISCYTEDGINFRMNKYPQWYIDQQEAFPNEEDSNS